MKLIFKIALIGLIVTSCKSLQTANSSGKNIANIVSIDLINTINDQVPVSYNILPQKKDTLIYYMPKTVPGTYSSDNYGQFITDFKASDTKGNPLNVEQLDQNSWQITGAKQLSSINYLVNDSFDTETQFEDDNRVFSPSGTNILADKNFVLNLHGFVGYFKHIQNQPYSLSIKHPKEIKAATSHKFTTTESKNKLTTDEFVDLFNYSRYAEVTDDPIIYGKLDNVTFKINDIEILLSVYSPNKIHTAQSLLPSMKKMMTAQKEFMGEINSTKKYSILLYLSTIGPMDAQGFGALEHNNSTVVILPELMPLERLEKVMIDVVSHEFFHIIAPLTIHSEEIHDFDYYDPKMSEHLWMYEGTTEYFAQHFQITEDLISEKEYLKRLSDKIRNSKSYDDTMSFTVMSKNILEEPYKANYVNVYEKGALISMCLDIIIRENSNGEKGILDLMKALSNKYGAHKPFLDSELISEVTNLTFPEVGEFLNTHVVGTTPINYSDYFKRVGVQFGEKTIETDYFFLDEETPYIDVNSKTGEIFFSDYAKYNSFLTDLKIEPNDVLVSVNNKKFDKNNAGYLIQTANEWKIGNSINMLIKRGGIELLTKTVIKETPYVVQKGIFSLKETELTPKQIKTKKAWLNK